jgi:hypothetical protein
MKKISFKDFATATLVAAGYMFVTFGLMAVIK